MTLNGFECCLIFEFYLFLDNCEFVPNVVVVETKIFLVYSIALCCRMEILLQQMSEMILTYYTFFFFFVFSILPIEINGAW